MSIAASTNGVSPSLPSDSRSDVASSGRLLAGDSVTVDYTPGTGTTVLINGKPEGGAPIKEPEFFNALLKIWLGDRPADHVLKDALLGHSKA